MGNLFAYYVAVNCVDRVANRWFLHRQRRKIPFYATSINYPCDDSGRATMSQSRRSDCIPDLEEDANEFPKLPNNTKLGKIFVPYKEAPTDKELANQRATEMKWQHEYKLFFPYENLKMVVDNSYPLGGNIFDALKLCPFDEIDIEFRFVNLTLFDGEAWSSFCSRVKHLKLRKCRIDSATLFALVTNAKNLTSLKLVMPVISKGEIDATRALLELAPIRRLTLETLAYCGSDVDVSEPLLTLLFAIYSDIVDWKIHLKVYPYTAPRYDAELESRIFSDIKVCNMIYNRLVTSSKIIRALDLKLSDGSPADGCQIIPFVHTLFMPELKWLTKISFYIHQELNWEILQELTNLHFIRAVKWSIHFRESNLFTYYCCVFSISSFSKLRSLKIVHSECFRIKCDLLEKLTSSELQKLHITADRLHLIKGFESCPPRRSNKTLYQLKIRVNRFNSVSKRNTSAIKLMRICLQTFVRLRVLHFAPVKIAIMEDIIQYQPKLEELNVELYEGSKSMLGRFTALTDLKRIRAISELEDLKRLTIIDLDGKLDIKIFAFLTSVHIKSLKLFGHESCKSNQDELIEKLFRKFRDLCYFQCNTCLYILDPFTRCPRKILYVDFENYISEDFVQRNFKLVDSFQRNSGSVIES